MSDELPDPRPSLPGRVRQVAGRPGKGPLEQTLRQAAHGDPGAWRDLVQEYGRRVFGLVVRHCEDGDLAEEITQATFVTLVTKLADFAGYEERGRFEPWLFRIAMNRLRDEMRRRKRQATAMDMGPGSDRQEQSTVWATAQHQVVHGGPAAALDPSEGVSRAEQIDKLREAIATLSEADREVLQLRHTAGLTFAQIAETLGEPLGTVLARGHRAIGKLRKLMDESTGSQGPSRLAGSA